MCVSDGAPENKAMKDLKHTALQEFWNLMQKNNAVFVGDPGFRDEVESFLSKHNIKREKPTKAQERWMTEIDKMINQGRLVC